MAAFYIEVGGNRYEMEFTRETFSQFERLGYTLRDIDNPKPYTMGPALYYIGLLTHNPSMNPNLAAKIFDSAVDEYGIMEAYSSISGEFITAFMAAGEKQKGKKTNKSLIVKPKMTTTTAKSIE